MYNEEERKEERAERTERIPTFFRFEDLRVYHKSMDYLIWLQDVSVLFPENEKTQLAARFNDAARNISFYIAEGSSRNKTQFIHYLKMAKSSIRECLVFTTIAYRANHISDSYEEVSRNYLTMLELITPPKAYTIPCAHYLFGGFMSWQQLKSL